MLFCRDASINLEKNPKTVYIFYYLICECLLLHLYLLTDNNCTKEAWNSNTCSFLLQNLYLLYLYVLSSAFFFSKKKNGKKKRNPSTLNWKIVISVEFHWLGCCTSCAVRIKSGQIKQPEALGISAELKSKVLLLFFILRFITKDSAVNWYLPFLCTRALCMMTVYSIITFIFNLIGHKWNNLLHFSVFKKWNSHFFFNASLYNKFKHYEPWHTSAYQMAFKNRINRHFFLRGFGFIITWNFFIKPQFFSVFLSNTDRVGLPSSVLNIKNDR